MVQTLQAKYAGGPPVNYERWFVPAIGAPLARELVELAALQPGESALDVACGTGVVTRLAADRLGPSAVAGVDVNAGMLGVARQISDPAIEWHEAGAEALPLGDSTFDVVFCQLGIQFFEDRAGAAREMHRVLKPGGRIVLNVPGPIPPTFSALEQALRRHVGPPAGFVATVFSLHDGEQIGELLSNAGFRDVQTTSRLERLALPPAEDFLWGYIHGTPLAMAVGRLDGDARQALEREVVAAWAPHVEDGRLVVEVRVTSASAVKP